MKSLLLTLAVLLCAGGAVWAQEKEIQSCQSLGDQLVNFENPPAESRATENIPANSRKPVDMEPVATNSSPVAMFKVTALERSRQTPRSAFLEAAKEPAFDLKADDKARDEKTVAEENLPQTDAEEKFHWKPALVQSGIFLGIQNAARMYESKTRREFDGPFFRDWKNSVKNLRGWDDGGKIFTNYVAHPMQGATTGRIFINNSDRAKKQEFGKSKAYWNSRLKALAWSAVWSTQFEIGPFSEASLGNVGLKPHADGRSRLTWGDMIITPVIGTAWVIGEDAIDRYVLKNWIESKTSRKTSTGVKIARSFLTPTTSFSNLLRGKYPWKRDNRPN